MVRPRCEERPIGPGSDVTVAATIRTLLSDVDDTTFALSCEIDGSRAVMRLVGELDLGSAPRLREQIVGVVDAGVVDLVLDLAELEFIDSSGLSVLVMALKRLRERDGDLRLRSVPAQTRRVLAVSGLDRVFPMTAD